MATEHNHNEHDHDHDHKHGRKHSHSHEYYPSKIEVINETPDQSVRFMLKHMEQQGCENCFDRFDSQKPHCKFGQDGVCCRVCAMGPCRISAKSPRGVCGADADVIVARNLLRSVAAAVSAHGARSREVLLAMKAAANKTSPIEIASPQKVMAIAAKFGIDTTGKTIEKIADEVVDILLEDLSRVLPAKHKTLEAFAPSERIKLWQELDIMPIGAYQEVFEALHRSGTGVDGSWQNLMRQLLRCGLAFSFGSVLGGAIAMDCLYGLPKRSNITANLGALEDGYVNIAVHGHSPVLISEIVKSARQSELINFAKQSGAKGIKFYGICCSGLSSLYRYGDIHPLANAVGAEMAMATGAIDLWVADIQDVYPSIMDVANCNNTLVITTSDSCRLPGADHYGFDHHHSNIGDISVIAERIVRAGINRYSIRRDVPRYVPEGSINAEIGFSVENITEAFGNIAALAAELKSGRIKGIVNLVGCNNPKVLYEKTTVDITDILLANDIAILTNGCASFPLLKLGYCDKGAIEKAGPGLREVLKERNLPPVWHFGECLDNARASGLFRALADAASFRLGQMPFAFASPEWSNEKGIAASLSFRLMGINSYHCISAAVGGSKNVKQWLEEGTMDSLGSVMVTIGEPHKLAQKIITDINEKRKQLQW